MIDIFEADKWLFAAVGEHRVDIVHLKQCMYHTLVGSYKICPALTTVLACGELNTESS